MATTKIEIDLAIVGAGFYGLAAARTYHEIYPSASINVYDGASSLGGVWANERIYPGLKTNNRLGTYEYPDFPMDEENFPVKKGDYISGKAVHEYLDAFVEKFNIKQFLKLRSHVESVERVGEGKEASGWIVSGATTTVDNEHIPFSVLARKLIIATGLTSEPSLPRFPGQDTFKGLILHSRDFAKYASLFSSAPEPQAVGTNNKKRKDSATADLPNHHHHHHQKIPPDKAVAVLGANKSGWDHVHALASGHPTRPIHWIIRASGHGPCWFSAGEVEREAFKRVNSWMSPCVWGDEADGFSLIRRFLHRTWLGRAVVRWYWRRVVKANMEAIDYDGHPETKKLKPWAAFFHTASSVAVYNYPDDVLAYVRSGRVRVHVADIEALSDTSVLLSDGTSLDNVAALCCASGWKTAPPLAFLPAGIEHGLGLCGTPLSGAERALAKKADEEILARFPMLRAPPQQNPWCTERAVKLSPDVLDKDGCAPYRLYRFMVPPALVGDRSVAFAGMLINVGTTLCAQLQALWIAAYFGGAALRIEEDGGEEGVRYSAMLHSRSTLWRYPTGYSARFPDFAVDAVPYLDRLMRDLGLRCWRQGGWVREVTVPYVPGSYRGVIAEWMGKGAASGEVK